MQTLDRCLAGAASTPEAEAEALAFFVLTRSLGRSPAALRAAFVRFAAGLERRPALRERLAALEARLAALDTDAAAGFERLTGYRVSKP